MQPSGSYAPHSGRPGAPVWILKAAVAAPRSAGAAAVVEAQLISHIPPALRFYKEAGMHDPDAAHWARLEGKPAEF